MIQYLKTLFKKAVCLHNNNKLVLNYVDKAGNGIYHMQCKDCGKIKTYKVWNLIKTKN